MPKTSIKAIIGLGNIGAKYAGTRHNLGFEVLNRIASEWKLQPKPARGDYYSISQNVYGNDLTLVWPTTYMNNSGRAVSQLVEEYDLAPQECLVIYDDINLPLGKIRIRLKGSDGGHNGIGSVIEHLETTEIPRIRLGIGPLPENADQIDFVLGHFSAEGKKISDKMIGQAADAVLYSLKHSLEEAMNNYNINPAPE